MFRVNSSNFSYILSRFCHNEKKMRRANPIAWHEQVEQIIPSLCNTFTTLSILSVTISDANLIETKHLKYKSNSLH